jgi:hypothetical protein
VKFEILRNQYYEGLHKWLQLF